IETSGRSMRHPALFSYVFVDSNQITGGRIRTAKVREAPAAATSQSDRPPGLSIRVPARTPPPHARILLQRCQSGSRAQQIRAGLYRFAELGPGLRCIVEAEVSESRKVVSVGLPDARGLRGPDPAASAPGSGRLRTLHRLAGIHEALKQRRGFAILARFLQAERLVVRLCARAARSPAPTSLARDRRASPLPGLGSFGAVAHRFIGSARPVRKLRRAHATSGALGEAQPGRQI